MEKVACWRTKAAISLKRVKIEEKLLKLLSTFQSPDVKAFRAYSSNWKTVYMSDRF